MNDMTPRKAADRVESILRHADLTSSEVEVVRALRDHARAPERATADTAAAWAQHFDDTAAYAGGFTEPERAGIRAAARMMRDPDVQAQVAKTVGGGS